MDRVAAVPEGEQPAARHHLSAEAACADYIVAELEYWAAVDDERGR